jgi:hypothetical protein
MWDDHVASQCSDNWSGWISRVNIEELVEELDDHNKVAVGLCIYIDCHPRH